MVDPENSAVYEAESTFITDPEKMPTSTRPSSISTKVTSNDFEVDNISPLIFLIFLHL